VLPLENLLKIPFVDPYLGFEISPDGELVTFSWNRSGRWEIYITRLAGQSAPRLVTTGEGGKFAPIWAPDGRAMAYCLDADGSERFDIVRFDLSTGHHLNLTPGTPETIQPNLSWSPDGSRIAYASDRDGSFDTYIIPASGGDAQKLFAAPFPDWDSRWSPDGRWLAVVSEAEAQGFAIFIVPAAGGEPQRLTLGTETLSAKDPCWSPGGNKLAFASDRLGFFDLGIYDVETGEITWVAAGKGDQVSPDWSSDGRRLVYLHSHGPMNELVVITLATGAHTSYCLGAGVHGPPQFTSAGDGLVFTYESPSSPTDLWVLSLTDGSSRQLTRSLPVDLTPATFTQPVALTYPGLDGVPVPALLFKPQAERPPAVIIIHGGPNWLTRFGWDPLIQHMVSRGWLVLAPNYRGSTGYGRAWQYASRFDFGGVDTRDVVAGADYLLKAGLVDPRRVAVSGRSWGGYLTMTCLTQYPDRWVGGSAVVPFLNWFTGHQNSRGDLQHWDLENFGDPAKDHDLYRDRSPFFFLDRVAAPVQLICGAQDPRCPASESLHAHDVLSELGKQCELALYPDEGHIFLKTENVIDAEKRRVTFLATLFDTKGNR
jgi:dipeptidyl aminopeptidase/acylaminoacyl peptidase